MSVRIVDADASGDRAYLLRASGFLEVWDLAAPGGPALAGRLTSTGNFVAAHGNHAFVTDRFGLQVVDATDAGRPQTIYSSQDGRHTGVIAVLGDYLLAGLGSGGIEVLDVSDPASPGPVAVWPYAGAREISVRENGVGLRTSAEVILLDARDIRSPREAGRLPVSTASGILTLARPGVVLLEDGGALHAARPSGSPGLHVFASYALTSTTPAPSARAGGNKVFLQDGVHLRVLELSDAGFQELDRLRPSLIAGPGIVAIGPHHLLVSVRPHRLAALDLRSGWRPRPLRDTGIPGMPVGVEGSVLFVRSPDGQSLGLYGARPPHRPLGSVPLPTIHAATARGTVCMVGSGRQFSGGFSMVDISDVHQPKVLSTVPSSGSTYYHRDHVWNPTEGGVLSVYDVRDPAAPAVVYRSTLGPAGNLAFEGDVLVSNGDLQNLFAWDISDVRAPRQIGSVPCSPVTRMELVDGFLYATQGPADYQLCIFDLRDPAAPREVSRFPIAQGGSAVPRGGRVYVGSAVADLQIVDVRNPAAPWHAGGIRHEGQNWLDPVSDDDFFYLPTPGGNIGLLPVFCRTPALPEAPGTAGQPAHHVHVSPNPSRGAVRIQWSAAGDAAAGPAPGILHAGIFDVTGRRVATLHSEGAEPTLTWDGRGAAGVLVPPGVYFLRLDSQTATVSAPLFRIR